MKTGTLARWCKNLMSHKDGSVAVEFAFVAIPLMLLTGGIVEFARYSYTQSALHFAAEEATRYAVVRGGSVTESELVAVAQNSMLFLDTGVSAICITAPAGTATAELTVTISYDYEPIIGLVGRAITLSGESAGFIAFSPLNPSSNISEDCAEA
ncbi:MAG: TadE/TadG family type IV pilus assembly protein [Kiloniellales bacterium]|nr:TadE/TadG family type IV pilus assembly protein [Kiloniellales bacterium]